MIAEDVIAQLQAAPSNPFNLIDGAAELASVKDRPTACPAAYVYLTEEASDENQRIGGVLQITHTDFAVLIFAENATDATGRAVSADVTVLKSWVRAQLIGWQPPSAADLVTHVSGALVHAVRFGVAGDVMAAGEGIETVL